MEPNVDDIRRGIESQICPWCGKGPFTMLPVHTNKTHAIDKWRLRDLAGLTTNDPLCDPAALRKMSEHAKEHSHVDLATEAGRRRRSPQRWTAAGLAKNTETITGWMADNPEAHQEASIRAAQSITPEGRERQRAAAREMNSRRPPSEMRKVAERNFQSEEAKVKRAARRTQKNRPV